MVLLIDNYDSFTFNLAYEFESRGLHVDVWRNDVDPERVLALALKQKPPRLIVLSPGPGTPQEAGCSIPLIQLNQGKVPLFGVCLGHQAIVEAYGGVVGGAASIFHGKASVIHTDEKGVFAGLGARMTVARYHSLAALEMPDTLKVRARWNDMVMAVSHTTQPVLGVQFHPESILTTEGGRLIENVLRWAAAGQPDDS